MVNLKAKLPAAWIRGLKRQVTTTGLEASAALARAGMLAGARGRGSIFTLHHVRPKQSLAFQPSGHLEVTPEFLADAIERLSADGYGFVPLDEVPERLANPTGQPFAAFTLDDGYRNNAEHALPVFEKYGVPFTVFVARGFAERTHSMWWETMADLIGRERELSFDFGNGPERIELGCEEQKFDAFDRFADLVFRDDEASAVSRMDALVRCHGIDPLQMTADLTMDPAELRELSRHKLATLGAHTISHRAVGRLSEAQARAEMASSADYVEELTGIRPTTIAYPYGTRKAVGERDYRIARDLGFSVAVTTQPGTICEKWLTRLTGLPRISLNGHYQRARYVSALASGIPFKLAR